MLEDTTYTGEREDDCPKRPQKKLRILDGSFAAELEHEGYIAQDYDSWTFHAVIENLPCVQLAHKKYVDLGVDFITTNTYHAALPLLKEKCGYDREQSSVHIKRGIDIAKESASKVPPGTVPPRVLVSVGSYGACFRDGSEYTGAYVDRDSEIFTKLVKYYVLQLEVLEKMGNEDVIIIETVPTLMEAEAISLAVQAFPFQVVVSFTCKEDGLLRHGEKLSTAAKALSDNSKVIGIGINCTKACNITPALNEIRQFKYRDVFVYPNSESHEGEDALSKFYDPQQIYEWATQGATVVGGCCGIDAATLSNLRPICEKINATIAD